jgi:hypothetical protein
LERAVERLSGREGERLLCAIAQMISNWEKSIKKTKLMANNAFIIKNNCAYKRKFIYLQC